MSRTSKKLHVHVNSVKTADRIPRRGLRTALLAFGHVHRAINGRYTAFASGALEFRVLRRSAIRERRVGTVCVRMTCFTRHTELLPETPRVVEKTATTTTVVVVAVRDVLWGKAAIARYLTGENVHRGATTSPTNRSSLYAKPILESFSCSECPARATTSLVADRTNRRASIPFVTSVEAGRSDEIC